MGDIETDDRPTPRHPFTLYQYRRHGCSLRSLDPICDLLGHVRRLRRSPLQDPTHAERRQAGEALGGSVGQTDDGPRQATDRLPARADRQREGACGLRAEQSLASREGRLVKKRFPSSAPPATPLNMNLYYSERERERERFMYETQMAGSFTITNSAVLSSPSCQREKKDRMGGKKEESC